MGELSNRMECHEALRPCNVAKGPRKIRSDFLFFCNPKSSHIPLQCVSFKFRMTDSWSWILGFGASFRRLRLLLIHFMDVKFQHLDRQPRSSAHAQRTRPA